VRVGYAALSHLRQPVVDLVKLDRVFCRDTACSRNRSLIRSAVVLAEDLGIELVAEGIEDETTRATLIDLGCRTGQGYLFGPPMPFTQAIANAGPP
jgi:EAL domain-containing protein (putative c-di-GMP-specific phosphodiesterase class I)